MERGTRNVLVAVGIIAGISVLNAKYDILDVHDPLTAEGDWQSPVDLDLENIQAAPTTTDLVGDVYDERNLAPPTTPAGEDDQPAPEVLTPAQMLQVARAMQRATSVECPTETGLAYFNLNGSDVSIQVCVDSQNVSVESELLDGETRRWLRVPLGPDPNALLAVNWVASLDSVSSTDCVNIARAVEPYVVHRAEVELGVEIRDEVLPMQIVYAADEETRCDQDPPFELVGRNHG